ncbi:MAG: ABC transporter permease [Microbacterium sp.]|jgi:simple sugar transport system permease protein|uniref:Xylose transport system permease protein XylH n=1 Tax=Microbacterium ginsengisoli TaxID=400772 RepID=A0A0F0LV87_9MICO|nr:MULTISPECIES: ABC transporter permease [Microbacterium]MAL06354.1 ABC transporter permease [Microbacterium sp.]MCK9915516.1 ABC transporter permease [Microbacteriaceae bacterium K1510]KJL36210.1 Autoinducer 2 import system permease protein LsrD [Microbacterium ginsengisoli]KQR94051.1 ribose ABC transporter permease [Microbacterium sp. Leaf347]KQR97099.1 ribose ABC transporter permease [Microbacterium sp. Leaf351]
MSFLTNTSNIAVDERVSRTPWYLKTLRRPELGALIGAVAIFLLFTFVDTTGKFATLEGAAGWTDFAAPVGIVAVFVALLMIGGEFDLSSGVMVGTSGLFAGLLITQLGWNVWAAIAATVVMAAVIGFINGILVIRTALPSFIVTLGTFFVLKGANLAITKGLTGTVRVSGVDQGDGFDSARSLFSSTFDVAGTQFQISLVWWLVITIFATLLLTRTVFGNWIFASGGDANAARNAGVPVNRTKITLFVMTSVSASLVGIMFLLRLRGMQAGQGVGQEFYYIIAAAVGGTLLTGGAGSAIGASIGALIMGFAAIGIPYALWDQDWVSTFLGVILFSAVLINITISRRAQGGRKK